MHALKGQWRLTPVCLQGNSVVFTAEVSGWMLRSSCNSNPHAVLLLRMEPVMASMETSDMKIYSLELQIVLCWSSKTLGTVKALRTTIRARKSPSGPDRLLAAS
jgi:hypothetical protein